MSSYIGNSVLNDHMGSNPIPCYIQNSVILNHVIKRMRCICYINQYIVDSASFSDTWSKLLKIKFPVILLTCIKHNYEPCREKIGFLHMRKQRRRSTSR